MIVSSKLFKKYHLNLSPLSLFLSLLFISFQTGVNSPLLIRLSPSLRPRYPTPWWVLLPPRLLLLVLLSSSPLFDDPQSAQCTNYTDTSLSRIVRSLSFFSIVWGTGWRWCQREVDLQVLFLSRLCLALPSPRWFLPILHLIFPMIFIGLIHGLTALSWFLFDRHHEIYFLF